MKSWSACLAYAALILLAVGAVCRGQAQSAERFKVSLPKGWDRYLSVEDFSVIGKRFYGVRNDWALFPQVRFRWSLKNLSDEPLYVRVNYGSRLAEDTGGTGLDVGYVLLPREHREIDDFAPVISAVAPMTFNIRWQESRLPNRVFQPPARSYAVTLPLPASKPHAGERCLPYQRSERIRIEKVQLLHTEELGNALELAVRNLTDGPVPLGVLLSVGDFDFIDRGSLNGSAPNTGTFAETRTIVPSQERAVILLPYSIPPCGAISPFLAYRVSEPSSSIDPSIQKRLDLTESDIRLCNRDTRLVHWGSFDLHSAAEAGLVVLPRYVPVEGRARLIAEKRSKHFLFRFRPNSYAAQNIDRIIEQRERAYKKLSVTLDMDLTETVTVDLYPNMSAKGLGSGTKWTPANTVTKTHIAEVCNEASKTDPSHELAHIFSYHFGGTGGGYGLCESFAVYFEAQVEIESERKRVRAMAREGSLKPLEDVIFMSGANAEQFVLIDYLLKRDLATFKEFYSCTTRASGAEELDRACRRIYRMDLKGLELQWREHLIEHD